MTSNINEIQGLHFRCTFSILLKPSDVQPRFSSPQLDIQCSTWKKVYIYTIWHPNHSNSKGRLKQYYLVGWCENPTWTLARFFMASGSLTPCSFRSTSICCLISANLARRVARRCSNLQERNKWKRESLASAVHIGTLFFPLQYYASLQFAINLKFSSLSFVVRASPLHRYLPYSL